MNSPVVAIALPIALAIIMFGLGLSLTVDDFARVVRNPRTVAIALIVQTLVLPPVAFGLVVLFDLPALLGVGMMLLAATPGGPTANLFSHLFRGDVALNLSLTAINSVLAVVTLPVITNFAIGRFASEQADTIGLQVGKVVQVFAIVLVPVAIGMIVRRRSPGFAARMDRPVRVGSAVTLAAVVVATMASERENLGGYFLDVGAVTVVFGVINLMAGYWIPRLLRVSERQAIACSMEIGIHNSAIAITIAVSVFHSSTIAVPAAIYAVVLVPIASTVGLLISRRVRAAAAVAAAS